MSKKFWLLVSCSILFIIGTLLINWKLLQPVAIQNRGSYGDLFGFTNTLFSGLAFVGVIAAILIQSEELKLQREELKETRSEFEQQNNTLKKQAFENTFFNIQNQKINLIRNLHHSEVKGSKVIDHFAKHIRAKIKAYGSNDFGTRDFEKLLSSKTNLKNDVYHIYGIFDQWIKCYLNAQYLIKTSILIENSDRGFYEQLLLNELSESEFFFIYLFKFLGMPYNNEMRDLMLRDKIFSQVDQDILFKRKLYFGVNHSFL